MPIPNYKKIQLKSSKMDTIEEQLALHQFQVLPHVIDIRSIKNQQLALENLEEYFKARRIYHYPYPQYILSHIKNFETQLVILSDEKELPRHFDKRVKAPNVKEAEILNLCSLKQKRLSNISFDDIKMTIDDYRKSQKKLKLLCFEGQFLERVLKKKSNQFKGNSYE
jgi:hypothetical protein